MDGELINQAFDEAIRAFAGRTDVVTKPRFLQLDEAARARAWTMARIADADVLSDMHDAVDKIIQTGGSFRDFIDDIEDTMQRRGWEGPQAWHAQLVFNQNVGMAYTAGRWQQATQAGVQYWRFLASEAAEPRDEHKVYYDQIFKLGEGPMPPLDFGCQCGWEVVFDEELSDEERAGLETQPTDDRLQTGPTIPEDQEFQFRPASFFQPLEIDAEEYEPGILEALQRAAANDPKLKIRVKGAT